MTDGKWKGCESKRNDQITFTLDYVFGFNRRYVLEVAFWKIYNQMYNRLCNERFRLNASHVNFQKLIQYS